MIQVQSILESKFHRRTICTVHDYDLEEKKTERKHLRQKTEESYTQHYCIPAEESDRPFNSQL